MKAIIIKASGEKEVRVLEKRLTLEELQACVGGYIEFVPPTDEMELRGETMFANEDGIGLELPYNIIASTIARRDLVGDVVVIDYPDEEGEDDG